MHKPESLGARTVFSVSCVKFHIFTCLAMYFHNTITFCHPEGEVVKEAQRSADQCLKDLKKKKGGH